MERLRVVDDDGISQREREAARRKLAAMLRENETPTPAPIQARRSWGHLWFRPAVIVAILLAGGMVAAAVDGNREAVEGQPAVTQNQEMHVGGGGPAPEPARQPVPAVPTPGPTENVEVEPTPQQDDLVLPDVTLYEEIEPPAEADTKLVEDDVVKAPAADEADKATDEAEEPAVTTEPTAEPSAAPEPTPSPSVEPEDADRDGLLGGVENLLCGLLCPALGGEVG